MATTAAGGSRLRGPALLGLKILFSLGLLAFLLRRVPVERVAESLRSVDPGWLAAAALVLLASNVLGSWQWSRLLEVVGIRLPLWRVCAYYHVGLFFNNFLPANIGGDFARVVDASRHGPSRAAAFSTVLMDRLIGTLALAGLALVTTIPAIDRFHFSLLYLALVGFFALSVTLVWAVFHPAMLPAVERVMRKVGLGAFGPALDDLALRLQGFRHPRERGLLARLLAVAVVVQLARIAVHALVARALGISVPWLYFFLFVPLLAVIVSLPISLNGIGVREGAGIVLFGLVGVDRAAAFSLQFTTYLVAVGLSLLGGLVFLVRLPRRRAERRQLRRLS